jgi:hypothetical protein
MDASSATAHAPPARKRANMKNPPASSSAESANLEI